MSDTRVTAAHAEALYRVRMTTRLTPQHVEALYPSPRPPTRGTVLSFEALYRCVPVSRVTTLAVEVLHARAVHSGCRRMTVLVG